MLINKLDKDKCSYDFTYTPLNDYGDPPPPTRRDAIKAKGVCRTDRQTPLAFNTGYVERSGLVLVRDA